MRDQVGVLMDRLLDREGFGPEHLVYYRELGCVHDFDAMLECVYMCSVLARVSW